MVVPTHFSVTSNGVEWFDVATYKRVDTLYLQALKSDQTSFPLHRLNMLPSGGQIYEKLIVSRF